jgi:hypothetical protein
MSGTLLCILAFLSCLSFSVANWRYGLCVLMAWGYFFGILKAHYVTTWGHFIFDAATVGFYAGILLNWPRLEERQKWEKLKPWVIGLVAWPLIMALVPLQHYLVQLVGLRGNMFWIPMLLVGCMLDASGRSLLAYTLAILNIVAFGFAAAEYTLGVEVFVPDNEVTQIVMNSSDIAGGNKRIPSTFTNAHSYAGTMMGTIPWILGELLNKQKIGLGRAAGTLILVPGLLAALLGIFIAGPRSPVAILGLLILLTVFSGRVNLGFVALTVLVGTIVAYFVSQDERMQRFTELQDIDMVVGRMGGSLNLGFFEVLLDYPMGNGMGAGGTSLPYFIQQLLTSSVMMENEYARILLEQGLPGLLFFLAFVAWFVTRPIQRDDPARMSKTLLWFITAITFSTAFIGIGMMSSIPGTAMMLLGLGYCVTPASAPSGIRRRDFTRGHQATFAARSSAPAYQRGLART